MERERTAAPENSRRGTHVGASRSTGAIEEAAVSTHTATTLREWYVKRRAAIEKVEAAYLEVLTVKPMPPPRWVIAAGSATGAMWGDLADDLRRIAPPLSWKKSGPVLYKSYSDALNEMREPILALREACDEEVPGPVGQVSVLR